MYIYTLYLIDLYIYEVYMIYIYYLFFIVRITGHYSIYQLFINYQGLVQFHDLLALYERDGNWKCAALPCCRRLASPRKIQQITSFCFEVIHIYEPQGFHGFSPPAR